MDHLPNDKNKTVHPLKPNPYPVSPLAQSRFGAMTSEMLLADILFTSELSDSFAKNFIRYLIQKNKMHLQTKLTLTHNK